VQTAGYGAYQRVQAETSSPGEVIVLLYDALLKNLRRGIAAIEAGEPDIAEQLSPLYAYVFRNLVAANVNKDARTVRELETMIAPMRDAWVVAVRGDASPVRASQEATRA
jgi:flagellin-specific chaperone FliS